LASPTRRSISIFPSKEALIADRSRPLEDRLIQFYLEYVEPIFTYEWVRIFTFSGLRSYDITGLYLAIIRDKPVIPVCLELRRQAGSTLPSRGKVTEREQEAIWGLHGQIFYIAIRKFVFLARRCRPISTQSSSITSNGLCAGFERKKQQTEKGRAMAETLSPCR